MYHWEIEALRYKNTDTVLLINSVRVKLNTHHSPQFLYLFQPATLRTITFLMADITVLLAVQ